MASINFQLDEALFDSLQEMVTAHCCYLSEYINLLNSYINFIKKVSTLKNERQTLIKYVKKLRYLNNYYSFDEKIVVLDQGEELSDIPLIPIVRRLSSFNIKVLEILDLLNYQVTQSIKNEIVLKTLNFNIIFSDSFIKIMEDTYRVFVKFNQWMHESLEITGCDMGSLDSSLSIELIDIATKCAIEDGIDLSESTDIILQQVQTCITEDEYTFTMNQWIQIIKQHVADFNTNAEEMISGFHAVGRSSKPNTTTTIAASKSISASPKKGNSPVETSTNNINTKNSDSSRVSRSGTYRKK